MLTQCRQCVRRPGSGGRPPQLVRLFSAGPVELPQIFYDTGAGRQKRSYKDQIYPKNSVFERIWSQGKLVGGNPWQWAVVALMLGMQLGSGLQRRLI